MENIVSYTKEAAKFQRKTIFNAGVESSKDYVDPQQNYVPKVQLLVSPFGLPFMPIEIIGSNAGSIIKSLSWSKDRSNPGGALSLTISPNPDMIRDIFEILKSLPGGSFYSKIWNELGFDLEDLFKPKTLCQLWIDGYHVATLTVRGCRRQSSVTNDSYAPNYTLTFDELGNLYSQSLLRLDTFTVTGAEQTVADSMNKSLVAASNIKLVDLQTGLSILVNSFITSLFVDQGMNASDGLPMSFRLLATPWPIGGVAKTSFASNITVNTALFTLAGGQSFWEFMKNFIPNPWMEFFTESGGRTIVTESFGVPSVLFPGFNYLVARSTPYSNPMLGTVNPAHLPTLLPFDLTNIQLLLGGDFVIITDDDIHSKDIGFDCSNQATSFRSTFSSGSGVTPTDINDKPIISVGPLNPAASGGLGTFGVVEMVETINNLQLFDGGITTDNPILSLMKKTFGTAGIISKPALSNLLATWFRNQSRFREGSVTVKLKPWARPGMYCLYLPRLSGSGKPENPRDIGIYYIDSLSHDYGLENDSVTATTTLNLIRGVPLPTTAAKTALHLFDYEILPPGVGIWDGEFKALVELKRALKKSLGLGS
jgi:hypothetical protein